MCVILEDKKLRKSVISVHLYTMTEPVLSLSLRFCCIFLKLLCKKDEL